MQDAGAEQALVSGSGPTVVGLFDRANASGRVQRAAAELRGHVPEPIAATSVNVEFARAVEVAEPLSHEAAG
jgi:4-diphosphocytidyl-2C-methyl-D-erythritol kinase